jgi:hypothetical protein
VVHCGIVAHCRSAKEYDLYRVALVPRRFLPTLVGVGHTGAASTLQHVVCLSASTAPHRAAQTDSVSTRGGHSSLTLPRSEIFVFVSRCSFCARSAAIAVVSALCVVWAVWCRATVLHAVSEPLVRMLRATVLHAATSVLRAVTTATRNAGS